MSNNQVLESISIKNSFAHKNTFIKFKAGRNYIIGGYGSGKSELIEMIGFAFFGSSALRGKASTYPKLIVELVFNYKDSTYKIIRKTSDASLFKEDVSVAVSTTGVNEYIISLLGYDYNIFLLSNYCQQGKLQYFSEMTPAKRLQFIDKINGIEDAKELSAWLTTKRKTLKASIESMQPLLVEPKLKAGVDALKDYDEAITKVEESMPDVSTTYNEIETLMKSLKSVPTKIKPPTDDTLAYVSLSKEVYQDYVLSIKRLVELESNQTSSKSELNQILKPKVPINLQRINTTGDQIDKAIQQIMINSLEDISIDCPSCSHTFHTSDLQDHTEPLTSFSIKDLYTYKDWLSKENQERIKELEDTLSTISTEIEELGTIEVIPKVKLNTLSISKLNSNIMSARELVSKYEDYVKLDNEVSKFNKEILTKVEVLKTTIEDTTQLKNQLQKEKEGLLQCKVNQELYLEHTALYLVALEQFNKYNEEFIFINQLLKDIVEETSKIKESTIPSINYHASQYLNTITQGVMSDISITENYDLIVDGCSINLKSGAQKDLSSLAFRLSLGKSIVLGMLPLFIGDEIDSSSPIDVAEDIALALETVASAGCQVLLITHKDISNLEDIHVINLG